MVCKNCAVMTLYPASPALIARLRHALPVLALAAAGWAGPAQAEKADRDKPINIVSERGGRLDVIKQRTEFNGSVVLSKGSMVLRAERLDVRETSDGYYQAFANGEAGKPVTFRQARDVPGEFIEGSAEQLEYDSRADTVRFIGNAVVRRMRGAAVSDEVTGAVINYDNRSEVFSVDGGQNSPHPNGKVRVVMMPRAASAPEPAPSAPPLQLQPSTQLQPRKPS